MDGIGTSKRIAPIFPVRDLDVALDRYHRLGFVTGAHARAGTASPLSPRLSSTSV
jgi:hypothetical protein